MQESFETPDAVLLGDLSPALRVPGNLNLTVPELVADMVSSDLETARGSLFGKGPS